MIFRQLFDNETWTYTYLLADESTREALLIDPVREQAQRDLALIAELGLTLRYVLETHVHADHVTGADVLRQKTGARTVAGKKGAPCADLHLGHGDVLSLGALKVAVLETPGHTDDSLSFFVDGKVFTGDALLIRTAGRTDFQNGDAGALYDSIQKHLFALPDTTLVYEEKQFNSRLAGKSREEFIALMKDLKLPAPKKLNEAVPANLACGSLEVERSVQ
jgi:glyoxylase-like metal-dependent hydrolase (beta-lactamase superfamily II)